MRYPKVDVKRWLVILVWSSQEVWADLKNLNHSSASSN